MVLDVAISKMYNLTLTVTLGLRNRAAKLKYSKIRWAITPLPVVGLCSNSDISLVARLPLFIADCDLDLGGGVT